MPYHPTPCDPHAWQSFRMEPAGACADPGAGPRGAGPPTGNPCARGGAGPRRPDPPARDPPSSAQPGAAAEPPPPPSRSTSAAGRRKERGGCAPWPPRTGTARLRRPPPPARAPWARAPRSPPPGRARPEAAQPVLSRRAAPPPLTCRGPRAAPATPRRPADPEGERGRARPATGTGGGVAATTRRGMAEGGRVPSLWERVCAGGGASLAPAGLLAAGEGPREVVPGPAPWRGETPGEGRRRRPSPPRSPGALQGRSRCCLGRGRRRAPAPPLTLGRPFPYRCCGAGDRSGPCGGAGEPAWRSAPKPAGWPLSASPKASPLTSPTLLFFC